MLLDIYKMRSLLGQAIGAAWPSAAWNVDDGHPDFFGQEKQHPWKDTPFNSLVF